MKEFETEYEACWITKAGLVAIVVYYHDEPRHWRCGYVCVPQGHALYLKNYEELNDIDVHGGLTYSDAKLEIKANVWWFGFDAAHYNDNMEGGRPLAYMQDECEKLAEQLQKYESK